MARYIELNAVIAEIDKRIMDAPINNIGHQRVWAYNDVKDILNTLEVKEAQEEPVSEDLEKVAEEWDESLYRSDAFKAGANWQKEQIMKEAIDTTIKQGCTDLGVLIKGLDKDKFSFGDKVKVIIIKSE